MRDDVMAIRTAVALSDGTHLACARVESRAALDQISPRKLHIGNGQMLHTLFLDDAARPVADIYLACDDDTFLVYGEGDVIDHLAARGLASTDLSATHAFLCIDGPYAWELVAELTSPDVIGIPYLGFFHAEQFTCFRAGKSGEYGYDLLVPREHVSAVRERILDVGRAFDLRVASRAALDLCALEAGFFNVRHQSRAGLTPVELQLQWRVTPGRIEKRAPAQRTVMFAAPREVAGDITLDAAIVGSVLQQGYSVVREEQIGVALVDVAVAHAGLRGFHAGETALRTISSPAVNNRSLYVDPQRHTYATRDKVTWPSLARQIT
jgi:glycine cleavage system aminomethyltransferase T